MAIAKILFHTRKPVRAKDRRSGKPSPSMGMGSRPYGQSLITQAIGTSGHNFILYKRRHYGQDICIFIHIDSDFVGDSFFICQGDLPAIAKHKIRSDRDDKNEYP